MRVLGDVTAGDALDVLREVDEVYIETIKEYGLYDEIWQAFAVFLPVKCALALLSSSRFSFAGVSLCITQLHAALQAIISMDRDSAF